jgi:nucleoside-diphosphate-sugar epimerase
MNIGIVGANGFLGRNLCLKYLHQGDKVYALYNKGFTNIPPGCILTPTIKLPIDFLDCLFITIGNHTSNYLQFLEQISSLQSLLINLYFNRVIFISSTAVYGNHSNIIKLNSCFNNPSLYGMSKLTQEFFIRVSKNYAIVRPTYIYGSGMNRNSLIPIWLANASQKKIITIFGNGNRRQDYLYINDLIELCYRVANDDQNSIVLAASGKSISNLELANLICQYLPETFIQFQGEDYTPSNEFDITETFQYYNWDSKYSIEIGLQSMLSNEDFNL